MLRDVGFPDLEALIEATVPKNIRLDRDLDLPEPKSETDALAELRTISRKNKVAKSFLQDDLRRLLSNRRPPIDFSYWP